MDTVPPSIPWDPCAWAAATSGLKIHMNMRAGEGGNRKSTWRRAGRNRERAYGQKCRGRGLWHLFLQKIEKSNFLEVLFAKYKMGKSPVEDCKLLDIF